MKKTLVIVLLGFLAASCGNSNKPQIVDGDFSSLSFEDKDMGSEEWKLKEIQSIKSDSASLRDTDYEKLAEETNSQMSSTIDFLSSHSPSWSGHRDAYDDFYSKDKRASVPISYIVKTSKAKLNQILPSYRKKFAKNLANSLWDQDIYVTSSGGQNTILNITGGVFAANQNISDMQSLIRSDAIHFGFKQVRYRWYKGADEYTSYTLSK